ncbi:nadph--cytochrome p450 reductase [Stylonychia lemnae]|uniref:NADPH--hemoprotein reductase n=1 Tax=Stylonychia lemnae TaxID=5949 RepID=A0A077ZRC9_STYLE|nr:nadph--cytochrome p450 reductase [Stylonychia lemnae]|eukprot:CDW71895.1 nadph--cytochrome p450 reductase [Stylonychia lemnae]
MIAIIVGVFLVCLGLALILIKKKAKPQAGISGGGLTAEAQAELDKKNQPVKPVEGAIPLESLQAPSNFPSEVVFYFGSQTGTAEKFCQTLDEELQKIKGVQTTRVIDFEEFKPEVFTKHPLIIFCVATHYEGDPCDNTKKAFRWIRDQRKIKDEKPCQGMKYTVFGLGDTSYEQYNTIGKLFNEALEELGGERIYRYGEGNAEGNKTEDDFNEWRKYLWKELMEYYDKNQTQEEKQITLDRKQSIVNEEVLADPNVVKEVQYPLVADYIEEESTFEQDAGTQYEMASKQFITAKDIPIKYIKQLRQNLDEGSTLEISYDLNDSGLSYKTAANLALFPQNDISDVVLCAERLKIDINKKFILKTNPNSSKKGSIKHPFPTPATVQQALQDYIDLKGKVGKKTLKDLSNHATDTSEKENSLKYPNEVRIAISLTEDEVQIDGQKVKKMGLTSAYVKKIAEQNLDFSQTRITNKIFIKDSLFKQPSDYSAIPIIMVGPGTGVVPFIGFMEERDMLKKANPDMILEKAQLYFGCRKNNSDFIYKDEILDYKERQIISDTQLAFSRESVGSRCYVQDLMKQNKDHVIKVLTEDKGNIYLCGNTKMGLEVQNILKEFLGEETYKKLESDKRLVKELWG